ncbi:pectinesterase inhibitor 10-like [Lactuca sativa]|uniref:pectinesterase inhibitor 10-like n=1 Tax=Lactuca sativa TaxID=4236 RepID=UPI000CD81A97|nr:pectinesterase inhibitor 10-like [Lactuca sativa]
MARRHLTSSPSHSDPKDDQSEGDDDEGQHKGSPRGNTHPWSPTPKVIVNDSIPTPPPSPPKTTVQVTIAPLPPVISTPITTSPLQPPLFSNATLTSTPIITSTIDSSVNISTSDVGAKTEEPPKVTTEPLSPTPSNESSLVFGGVDFEFDSTYYSPYQIPNEEDESAIATKQHFDSVHEKLDNLIASTKKYNDVVLKAFMDTTLNQYTDSIDKCIATIDDSTSLCRRASADVKDLIQDSKVFLDSLKGHANSNAAKLTESIDSLFESLQVEQTKFEIVSSDLSADNKTFLSFIDSRF